MTLFFVLNLGFAWGATAVTTRILTLTTWNVADTLVTWNVVSTMTTWNVSDTLRTTDN